jgi:N-acetylneuraminate synthase
MTDTLIIAEIGSVHDGSFGNAIKLIEAAAACGADAAKFQTHIAAAETLRNAPMPAYFKGEPRFEYFERTGFTRNQWRELKQACDDNKVLFLSSPFSLEAVDLLEDAGVGTYKIPSGEVTNIPLLEKVRQTGKPALLSSGMSDWTELDAAMAALKGAPVTILQCTSAYPCKPEEVGLNVIGEMAARYKVPVGFSDHTIGYAASFAAAAMGATVIEKHFTYSRLMYGSDAKHSMEPEEFRIFAQGLRDIWKMRSHPVNKGDVSAFSEMKRIFQKSIVLQREVKKGTGLKMADLAFKKPGDGIPASQYQNVLGRQAVHDLAPDHQLSWDDIR